MTFFHIRRSLIGLISILSAGWLCGCYTAKNSEPPRTATEQLLLSTASDNAMKDVDLEWVKGKKVYVEEKYFDSYDKGYVISLIRDHLSSAGALLVKTNAPSDVIVEIRSGGLGINSSEYMIGVPVITVPIPFSGPMQTPEIAFYKSQKADAIGKFALFAYVGDTGEHLKSEGPVSGYAHFHLYKALVVSWRRTNVPQLKLHPKPDHGGTNGTPQSP
jgi:hypothetical protein